MYIDFNYSQYPYWIVEMTLSEDYRVNRLTESLDLFEEISSSDFFSETGTSFCNFVNYLKRQTFFYFTTRMINFARRLHPRIFRSTFPTTKVVHINLSLSHTLDDGSYDSCLRYIQSLFHEKCGVASSKQIHTFVTVIWLSWSTSSHLFIQVSLDAESISGTLEKVNDILKKRLEEVL